MQPCGLTVTRPLISSIAAVPSGQRSTQIVHSWPSVRTHKCSRHTAVPMSMSGSGVGTSAPLGHACMQYRPSHTTHGIAFTSMYGAPLPLPPVASILMHLAGQTLTHSPDRLHVLVNAASF